MSLLEMQARRHPTVGVEPVSTMSPMWLTGILMTVVVGGWLTGWWIFGRNSQLRTVAVAEAQATVDVVIPARNGAERLPRLLRALTHQTYLAQRVIVVDDESDDSTAALATAAGATVVHPGPRPPGWTGVSWAGWGGATAGSAELLVFLDADTEPAPDLVRQLVSEYSRLGGLLSVQPYHRMTGLTDRLTGFIDLVNGAHGTARPSGACMVVSRRDYLAVGGHHAIATALADGPALAERFRAQELPVQTRLGRDAIERSTVREGRAALSAAARHHAARIRGASDIGAFAPTVWLLGVIAAVIGVGVSFIEQQPVMGLVMYALVAVQLAAVLPRYGDGGWWLAVVFPIPVMVFVAVFGAGVVLRMRGSLRWRRQATDASARLR